MPHAATGAGSSRPSTVIGRGGSGVGAGPGDDRAVGDLELGAVAGAVDGAVRDLVAQAPDVRADRAEGLEDALGRLGDHDLGVGEDHAAADRDVGGLAEHGAARAGRAGRLLAGPGRMRWRPGAAVAGATASAGPGAWPSSFAS